MTRRSSHARCAAAALLLVLTGCGSDEPIADAPTPQAPVSESPLATGSESGTSADAEETAAVAPADGVLLEVEGMSAHAPRGWVEGPDFVSQAGANPRLVLGTSMDLYSFPVFGELTMTTDDLAEDSTRSGSWKRRATRRDDVVIDGVDAFHVAGQVNPDEYADVYGAVVGDLQLTVVFSWEQGEDRAYRDEVIGSVLASVDLAG
jgi:hypothetical protein